MDKESLTALLHAVAEGRTDVDQAVDKLRDLPFADLGYATIDHHRALRVGMPEVVFGEGKTVEQLVGIVGELDRADQPVLVTRLTAAKANALLEAYPAMVHNGAARTALLQRTAPKRRGRGTICIVTGGTSDIPVAEEAAVTAEAYGNDVDKLYDVGVAGIHRLLARRDRLTSASVVIAVAGMEAALASVVGGLVDRPVIAVPTSVGYGANFGGVAALLSMLNSCASGVTVVNIDNGFGAAYAAALYNRADS